MARTVHYFDWQDLIGVIPEDFALEALDDDNDGVAEMWDTARAAAEDAVDGYLEGRYAVPIPEAHLPSLVKRSAVLFCAADCYSRRRQEDAFPYKRELASRIKTLEQIRDGKTQLTHSKRSAKPRGFILSEPSRTYGGGRLGS
jgi:phage gp36-like protein